MTYGTVLTVATAHRANRDIRDAKRRAEALRRRLAEAEGQARRGSVQRPADQLQDSPARPGFSDTRTADAPELPRATAQAVKLSIQSDGRIVRFDSREIVLVASADNYVLIRAQGRNHLHRSTLAAIERLLRPASFVRVHRQYLVNPAHMRELSATDVLMSDGSRAPVSRRLKDHAKAGIASLETALHS